MGRRGWGRRTWRVARLAPAVASRYEWYTAHHHLRAAFAQGIVSGVFVLNEYVAVKTLQATRWHVVALLLTPALFQAITVAWNPATRGRPFGISPFLFFGIPGRLLLFLPLLFPGLRNPTSFSVIVATSVVAEILLIPAQNTVVASNYPPTTRGRWFGLVTAVQALTIATVALPSGWLLDHDPGAWPLLHGVAALAGAWGALHWSRLRRRRPRARGLSAEPEHGSALAVLRHDRTFLAFEACFMVYGTGFLMLQPVLPIYLVEEVGVTYAQVGTARGVIFWLAMVVAGPFFGRLSDRIGILRSCAIAYAALALMPVLLLTLPGVTGLNVSFTMFGLAMAGVHVAWNLGPIAIADGRDPVPYLNAHVSLVGLRALVGMVGGSWLQHAVGSRPVFVLVTLLELLAAAGMIATARASGRRWRLRTGRI